MKKDVIIMHARGDLFDQPKKSHFKAVTFAISKARWGKWKVAVAMCGKKDNFNRKLGRKIATDRLEVRPTFKSISKGKVLEFIAECCVAYNLSFPLKSMEYFQERANGKAKDKTKSVGKGATLRLNH